MSIDPITAFAITSVACIALLLYTCHMTRRTRAARIQRRSGRLR